MIAAQKNRNLLFSNRLQHIIDKLILQNAWSGGLLPDRLFLAILEDRESYGSLIINGLLRDWEIAQVVRRVKESIAKPGPRGVIALKGPATLRNYVAARLKIIYGDDLPPALTTGHVLLAILNDRRLFASRYMGLYWVRPVDVFQYLVRLPAFEEFVPGTSRSC